MSDQYASFDTHIAIVHDILCHLIFVIKCNKMTFYGILWHSSDDIKSHGLWQYGYQRKRIDQTKWAKGFRIISQQQNIRKIKKTKMPIFPFIFWGKKNFLTTVLDVEIINRFLRVFCIDLLHNNHKEAEWIFKKKKEFQYTLMCIHASQVFIYLDGARIQFRPENNELT